MRCVIVCLISFFPAMSLAPNAMAQDHLTPEDSIFSSFHPNRNDHGLDVYASDILTLLSEAYAHDVKAGAVVIPSTSPEYAVAILKHENSYRIMHLHADQNIWYTQYSKYNTVAQSLAPAEGANDSTPPAAFPEISVARCELAIPSDLGEALAHLWRSMLLETRYEERPRSGLDGITYHFYSQTEYPQMAGQAWSPHADTKPGKLAEIVEKLKSACLASDASQVSELYDLAAKLSAEIEE